MESPQKYVREYRWPQIPVWSRVYDTPLTEEKADPILLHDMLGAFFIYSGGILISGTFLMLELIGEILKRFLEEFLCKRKLHQENSRVSTQRSRSVLGYAGQL